MNNLALAKTENAVSMSEWQIMQDQARTLVGTGFLPQSIKTPEQAIAIMLQGRELGIPTMAALGTINVIQGKPTVSPQLMLALIERSGQLENIEFEQGPAGVSVTMKRKNRSAHTEFFGTKEATALGLAGKDNYKKQAQTMFKWRAVAACARTVFPDVILGLYTPEEMGANTDESGEYVQETAQIHALPTKTQLVEEARPQLEETIINDDSPDAIRVEKINEIAELCSELNVAKDSIKWKSSTLKEYVNEMFEVDDGLESLSFETFEILIGDLTQRLEDLQG